MTDPDFVRETLEDLKARDLYRRLVAVGSAAGPRVRVGPARRSLGEGGRRMVLQFASNNYLGLANDPRVREAARKAVEKWGWGAGASRLTAGHTDAHAALEADLAAFKHTEAALVFPTGYMANLGVISALVGRGDTVLSDRENHASIYDGIRLSGAELARYRHADADDATAIMKQASPSAATAKRSSPFAATAKRGARRLLLVTDTVFSMGGDIALLAALADACRRAGAMLLLDEAHATGVLGPRGAGLGDALLFESRLNGAKSQLAQAITASVGTLSKALGGIGGFVAASREVCELLVNRARPFIYSTALPAAACEAARAALKIVRREPQRRRRLLALADRLRAALRDEGFDTGRSETQIIPVIVGDPERALALAAALLERGIFCPAIRPPTVPPRTSRIRISLTAEHTDEDIARLVRALVAVRG